MEENNNQEPSEIFYKPRNIVNESKSSELLEDLIENLEKTIENTSYLINDLIQSIDKIIKDDEIKHETKELINGINEDFKNKIDSNFKYLSDAFNNKNLIEE